jgi:hypothetical protein
MSGDPPSRKGVYLATLRDEHRPAPWGIQWHEFFVFLESRGIGSRPPVPLILGGSGASARTKLERLSQQLEWAEQNGCLEEALGYLGKIPLKDWNSCTPQNWDKEFY